MADILRGNAVRATMRAPEGANAAAEAKRAARRKKSWRNIFWSLLYLGGIRVTLSVRHKRHLMERGGFSENTCVLSDHSYGVR